MDWSEESLDIEQIPDWLIVATSISIVSLLVVAPCFSARTVARTPSRSRRRRRAGAGGSSTSSSQFISVEESAVEMELRTVPAPARSTLSMARRSQLMEHQQAASKMGRNATPVVSIGRAMSQAAGSVLEEIETELDEAEQEEHEQMHRSRFLNSSSRFLYDEDDEAISIMPALHPDEIAPEDAADAHDIGIQFPHYQANNTPEDASTTKTTWQRWCDLLLDIANPFFETRRILNAALPTFIANLVMPLQHVCIAVVIGEFLNTESALAYILVELFLRVTMDNLSSTICEAHSNLLHQQYPLGNTLQLALCLQLILLAPVMVIWYVGMEGTLQWLLGDPVLAEIARTYTTIGLWEHLVRSLTRGFVQPFRWMIQHEMSLIELVVSSVSILIIVGIRPDTLRGLGIVQLSAAMVSAVIKIYLITTRGWFQPFRKGLIERLMLLVRRLIQTRPHETNEWRNR